MSRFDRLVLSTLFVLALLIGALAWRGDRVGATVVSVSPAPGATDVSTRATVRINFGQEMPAEASGTLISFNPPVSGTVRWEGKTLAFVPSASLAQQTTYTATLTAGLKSQQGRPVLAPPTWHFRTGQMRILYVGGGQPDRDQLMVVHWRAVSLSRSRKSLSVFGTMHFQMTARRSCMPRCARMAAVI
jgi:hypothetical protein